MNCTPRETSLAARGEMPGGERDFLPSHLEPLADLDCAIPLSRQNREKPERIFKRSQRFISNNVVAIIAGVRLALVADRMSPLPATEIMKIRFFARPTANAFCFTLAQPLRKPGFTLLAALTLMLASARFVA